MVYRRTEKIRRRLAERRDVILSAARELAAERGMAAVQIVPVATRAGIAAGTMYRYFPSKTDLVAALMADLAEREVAAMRSAAEAAPGPLSALAAALTNFAARTAARRRLAWAVMAEPIEAGIEQPREGYRKELAEEIAVRIKAAVAAGYLPDQDAAVSALALVGALVEGLIGPPAPEGAEDEGARRDRVRALALLALRAVGVLDARARGLVVQTALPAVEGAA